MGTYHRAYLVYGYDLGNTENYEIEEVGESGLLDMPWIERDEDGYPDEDLTQAISRKLRETIPEADQRSESVKAWHGVEILEHGWLYEGNTPSFALIAHEVRCDGGDAERVDLTELLQLATEQQFDQKLAKALEVLQITPKQAKPCWLLLASR